MTNLHVVFTMNPSTDGLKDRASTSPALFNRCVLNWFGDWSTGAFYQVAREFTNKIDLENSNVRTRSYLPLYPSLLVQLIYLGCDSVHVLYIRSYSSEPHTRGIMCRYETSSYWFKDWHHRHHNGIVDNKNTGQNNFDLLVSLAETGIWVACGSWTGKPQVEYRAVYLCVVALSQLNQAPRLLNKSVQ